MKLEDLQPDATVRGILPEALVTVVSIGWHGSDALTLVYRGPNGRGADEILYRHDEPRLEIVEAGRPWSFDGDGALFRLVAEAHRIRLAHLFDPVLAVHTSPVDPLPHLLKRGTVLVDDGDLGTGPRVLFTLEHAIQDASLLPSGERRTISRRMLYVAMDAEGHTRHLHYAPYLDYRPLAAGEPSVAAFLARPECAWITRALEQKAQSHAIALVVPEHIAEVRGRRLTWIEKTRAAVKDRLTKEITYWDHRAEQLKLQEQAGRAGARLNSQEARRRADDLQARLQKRLAELDREAQVSALPPVVLGGLVVVPLGLVAAMTGRALPTHPVDTPVSAARARTIVMETERALGFEPTDREFDHVGYDIESRVSGTGRLRFLEVKGRVAGADTITVTKNEILYSFNKPDDFIFALVEFLDTESHRVHYLRRPFERSGVTTDFSGASVNFLFADLLARAEAPR